MTGSTAYAADIHLWCASMHVAPDNNPEMVRDYIDHRGPTLSRSARNNIFKAAMKPAKGDT